MIHPCNPPLIRSNIGREASNKNGGAWYLERLYRGEILDMKRCLSAALLLCVSSGYYTACNIYARQYFETDISANEFTVLNYVCINLSNKGECVVGDEWGDSPSFVSHPNHIKRDNHSR